ncbi:MAG TPA: hypothetical protein VFW19_01395 [Allosphingosinicella sp.]|nr:hypothetical protein [Allosphingosinicella sp.]
MSIGRCSTLAVLALLPFLSDCGPPLGVYRIDRVDIVAASRLLDIDPRWDLESPSPLLRIVFTSDQDVETASGGTGSGLYLWGDFCPFGDGSRLRVAGPYYGDRSIFPPATTKRLPRGVHEVSSAPNRHPPRDPRTGRFIYTGYLFLRGAAYDLTRDHRDICLGLSHPGYYLTRSRSDVFTLPAASVAAAIARGVVTPPPLGAR